MVWSPGDPVLIDISEFILRSLREEDINQNYANWWADPGIIEGIVHPKKPGTVERHRERLDQVFDNRSSFQIGIFAKDTNSLIGFFTIRCTPYHRLASVELVVGDYGFRKSRILTGPFQAMISFIIESLKMEKITAKAVAHNTFLTETLQENGFAHAATLRSHWHYHNGQRSDMRVYELLAHV